MPTVKVCVFHIRTDLPTVLAMKMGENVRGLRLNVEEGVKAEWYIHTLDFS